MKKLSVLLITLLSVTSFNSFAKGPSGHGSEASKHSVLASAHGVTGSAQVASAVVAVPLLIVGSVGVSAASAGSTLIDATIDHSHADSFRHRQNNQPLEISEITITVDRSPADAMKSN